MWVCDHYEQKWWFSSIDLVSKYVSFVVLNLLYFSFWVNYFFDQFEILSYFRNTLLQILVFTLFSFLSLLFFVCRSTNIFGDIRGFLESKTGRSRCHRLVGSLCSWSYSFWMKKSSKRLFTSKSCSHLIWLLSWYRKIVSCFFSFLFIMYLFLSH